MSVALLSVGLGGYVSLKVATALMTKRTHVQLEIHACEVVSAVAAVMILALTCLGVHSWFVRRQIAKFTLEGIGLFDETAHNEGNSGGEMSAITTRVRTWTELVEGWLLRHDYPAYVHFKNPSGQTMGAGLKNLQGREGTWSEVDTRLGRLAEITTRRL